MQSDTDVPPASTPLTADWSITGSREERKAFFSALGKARAAMAPLVADSTGQFQNRTFKYADLASIYAVAFPELARNDLALLHLPAQALGPNVQRLSTMIAGHGCELTVSTDFAGSVTPDNVKGFGSVLTYLSRYHARALLALAGDDDLDNDGKAATDRFQQRTPPSPTPPTQQRQGNGKPQQQRAEKPPRPEQTFSQQAPKLDEKPPEPTPGRDAKSEGDDAPAAVAPANDTPPHRITSRPPPPDETARTKSEPPPAKPWNETQKGQVRALMPSKGIRDRASAQALVAKVCGVDDIQKLTEAQATRLIDHLTMMPEAQANAG